MSEAADFLTHITMLNGVLLAQAPDAKQIIRTQQDLRFNLMPMMPSDFVELIHQFNLFEWNGAALFGVNPRSYYLDVVAENVQLDLARKADILVLGRDDLAFLVYNAPLESYQIVAQDDLSVIKNCQHLLAGLRALWRIR